MWRPAISAAAPAALVGSWCLGLCAGGDAKADESPNENDLRPDGVGRDSCEGFADVMQTAEGRRQLQGRDFPA